MSREKLELQHLASKILELISRKPEKAARILTTWVKSTPLKAARHKVKPKIKKEAA